jgi:hypothetical protein
LHESRFNLQPGGSCTVSAEIRSPFVINLSLRLLEATYLVGRKRH